MAESERERDQIYLTKLQKQNNKKRHNKQRKYMCSRPIKIGSIFSIIFVILQSRRETAK